jgi:hypothetical protein
MGLGSGILEKPILDLDPQHFDLDPVSHAIFFILYFVTIPVNIQ